jgi:hypothetical protein
MNVRLLLLGTGLILALSTSAWAPILIISTHEDNTRYFNNWPEIAVDTLGNSSITWCGSDGNDREVYWVRVDASGTPGTVQKISTHQDNISNDDWYPQISVDVSGNSYITWHCFHGDRCDIYWTKVDAFGTSGQVLNISGDIGCPECDNWNPRIAVDTMKNSYITWERFDGNDSDIFWAKIDAEGVLGMTQKISTHPDNTGYSDIKPQIAVDISGNSYVVWHGCDKENCWEEPGDFEIYWVRIDASGIHGMVQKIPPTNPDNINTSDEIPQIAVDASGNSYVVWSGIEKSGYNLYWVKIDASDVVGTIQKISTQSGSTDYNDLYPQIAVDSSGNSYIAWESFDGDDSDIYWVKIDPAGIVGAVQRISNYSGSTAFDDSGPSIAVDALGNSYVTWTSYNRGIAEQFDQRVCWVKIDAEGKPGRVQKIPSYPDSRHSDWNSRIALDALGNSYVTWEGEDAYGNDHIFFTARLPRPASLATVAVIAVMVIAAIVLVVILTRKLR